MASRPPQPTEAPDGTEWAVAPSADWRPVTGKTCRRRACPEPTAMEINRRRTTKLAGTVDQWWAYCTRHAYGNWVEGGQVVHWQLRELAEGGGGG